MPSQARKRRGAKTQDLLVEWFQAKGWSNVYDAGAGETGADLRGMPGLDGEVKARRNFSPLEYVRQAVRNATGHPFAVLRCNGQGPASISEWPVILPLGTFTALLIEAGYSELSEPAAPSRASTCQAQPHQDTPHLTTLPTLAEVHAQRSPVCTCNAWRVPGVAHIGGCPLALPTTDQEIA